MTSNGKTALITGISGQDGSYLAEFLIEKGYTVVGLKRWQSGTSDDNIAHIEDLEIIEGDLHDSHSLVTAIRATRPDEVYNLAAQSFVPTSWDQAVLTAEVTALGVTRMLDAIRAVDPTIRFYQASSSEMFGNADPVTDPSQNETTAFRPRSPYGVAKVYGHHITVNYRESYDMFAVSGIAFNHESPRRGKHFVTRKVTSAVARIVHGKQSSLTLGNLDAERDWGFSGDYVRAMWMMLQEDTPMDYVLGTGVTHSVRDLCRVAFAHAGLDYEEYVKTDPRYERPAELYSLKADTYSARTELGWEPTVTFEELIGMMVDADLEREA